MTDGADAAGFRLLHASRSSIAGQVIPDRAFVMRLLVSIVSATVIAGCCAAILLAQEDDPAVRRRDLERLRAEIRGAEARLRELEGESRRSMDAMREFRRQVAGVDSLVEALRREEGRLAEEMIDVRRQRDELDARLASSRAEFTAVTRVLFRNRLLTSDAAALLTPREQQRLALRQRLYERYVRTQRRRAGEITRMTVALAAHDSLLRLRQREQLALIREKRSELERLMALERDQAAALNRAAGERNTLERLVEQRNAEAEQISGMIASMVRREQSRAAGQSRPNDRRADAHASPRIPDAPAEMEESGALRFKWPTAGRRIVEAYGERTNPRTGTVTVNPGINIAARAGTAVTASERGTVSLVSWLPGYGTIVIVGHRDGYRTVYGNLSSANVSRGTKVKMGQRIGSVGDEFLHFEVWRDQTRLDPVTVLP